MTILFFKRTESDDTKFHIDIAEKKIAKPSEVNQKKVKNTPPPTPIAHIHKLRKEKALIRSTLNMIGHRQS